jgi:hypothetical protein
MAANRHIQAAQAAGKDIRVSLSWRGRARVLATVA